jgi:outer membrane protein OmpA-like peptidoglycan-associated protein
VAIAAASLALVASVASADSARHGWYFGLEAGGSFVSDADMKGTPNSYSFDMGWAGLAVAGYKFEDPLRIEIEAGFRDNNVGERNGVSVANGELRELTGFANLLWDCSSSDSNWGFVLGGGLGIDNARFKDHLGNDSREIVPAGQGIIGLNYRVGDHWEYTLNYRLLYADVGDYETAVGNVLIRGETDFVKHTITMGVRFGYDDPPAPPPPVAAPPPPPAAAAPKQFIVFFGFNKSNLTAEGQAVVTEAAATAKSQGSARITIVGHTDSVGSGAYNDELSLRRATAVKDELTRLGLSADAISSTGKGETELMVQTGDGVKEPQNRRATIDLN